MRRLAALALLAAAVAGCDTTGESPLRGDLVVELGPERVVPPASVVVRTTEDYPCANYALAVKAEASPGVLRVRVREVIEPEVCLTALGPASARVALPAGVATGFQVVVYGPLAPTATWVLTEADDGFRIDRVLED